MIHSVIFKQDDFENGYNCISDLTKNTIIFCGETAIKDYLENIFKKLARRGYEYTGALVDYCTEPDMEEAKLELFSSNEDTAFFKTDDGQDIIITVNPAFFFKSDNPMDIWFVSKGGELISFSALSHSKQFEDIKNNMYALYKEMV